MSDRMVWGFVCLIYSLVGVHLMILAWPHI